MCTGVEQSQWAAGVKAQPGWLLGDMGGRQKAPKDVRPWSFLFRKDLDQAAHRPEHRPTSSKEPETQTRLV